MRKSILSLMIGLALCGAVDAQLLGLPIADSATRLGAGSLRAGAHLTLGDEANLYGVRAAFGATESLDLFADLGLVAPDDWDNAPALQGGALYALPLDGPLDVAARCTIGFARLESNDFGQKVTSDLFAIHGGALASMDYSPVTPYAYLGLCYWNASYSGDGLDSSGADDIEPALAAGALFSLDNLPALSFFGEVAYIDGVFFSAGANLAF
ncbi:MAG: hypothetical protein K9N49_03860 [Candidatus Marinimicrobia bacterium]|nr:hypothetical protein [Candidatus Neomarinimicrobiota bacterium]